LGNPCVYSVQRVYRECTSKGILGRKMW